MACCSGVDFGALGGPTLTTGVLLSSPGREMSATHLEIAELFVGGDTQGMTSAGVFVGDVPQDPIASIASAGIG